MQTLTQHKLKIRLICAWHNAMVYAVDMHYFGTLTIREFSIYGALDRFDVSVLSPLKVQLSSGWD